MITLYCASLADTMRILEASEKHAIRRKSAGRQNLYSRASYVGNGDARRVAGMGLKS